MHSSTLQVKHDSMFIDLSFYRTSAESDQLVHYTQEDISSFLARMSLLNDIDSIRITLQPDEDSPPQELLPFLEKEVIDKILTTITQQDPIKFVFVIAGMEDDFSSFINNFIKIWQQKSLNIVGLNIAGCGVDGDTIKHLVAFLKTTQLQDFTLEDNAYKVSENDYICVIQLLQDLENNLTDFGIGNNYDKRQEITNKLLSEIFLKIKNNHKLKFLKISDMEKMTDSTLKIMKQCFKENSSLERLDFSGPEQGPGQGGEVIKKILNAVKHSKSIIDIDVSHQSITDDYMRDIAESLKSHRQIQTINFNSNALQKEGLLALRNALKINKSIIDLECDDDYDLQEVEPCLKKIDTYLKRNRKLHESYFQAKEYLESADQQANITDPTIELIEIINQAYQQAIDETKNILKKEHPKSQDLLDRCYLNYGLHLLRTGNYAAGYQCFNAIDKSSSYYSLKQNELANFIISYKSVQEDELQRRERLINALSLVPDLYNESCATPFKKIYMELMGEKKVYCSAVTTWQEIQKINPDKFNQVAIQIQKRQFYDSGVQPIIWDLQNQIIGLQDKYDSACHQIAMKNQEVSLSASSLFGVPKKRKREEEDNVDIKSPKVSFGAN
jgi:hypothetical protein